MVNRRISEKEKKGGENKGEKFMRAHNWQG